MLNHETIKNMLLNRKKIVISMLCLAFALRLASIFLVGDTELTHEYATYVPYMLEGKGFSYYSLTPAGEIITTYQPDAKQVFPSAFKPPVYSLLLAIVTYILGINQNSILFIEVFQVFLGVITCWLVYDIALMKFDARVAFVVLFLTSTYPLLVFSASQISDAVLQLFLVSFVYWLLFKFEIHQSQKSIQLLLGLVLGILIVARTETIAYIPFISIWLFMHVKNWKTAIFQVAVVALIIISIWVGRNYYTLGYFTLNTSGGLNFWEGQNLEAKGVPSWYTNPSANLSDIASEKISNIPFTNAYEVHRDSIYMEEALVIVTSNPVHVIRLALTKTFFYWSSIYPGVEFIYDNVNSPVLWLPWLILLPFIIIGLVINFSSFKKLFLFYISILLSTLTIMVFFVLPRYIIFILPWALMFASSGIEYLGMKWFLGLNNVEFKLKG